MHPLNLRIPSIAILLFSQNLFAKTTILPDVEVTETAAISSKQQVSIAAETLPVNVQVIDREQIEQLPSAHYLDLFRKLPGMVNARYGQGDIADNFGMRGFDGDHGSQTAIFIDGVPINTPNHQHAHGLADIGWLLPEMIERIEVIKGSFSALYGNFAQAGVINIITKKSDSSSVGLSLGTYGTQRAVGVYSQALQQNTYTPFLVYEAQKTEAYRDNSGYERYNAFNKVSFPVGDNLLSIRAHAVKRQWDAAGYASLNDILNNKISRTTATNLSDGGDSRYTNLVLNYAPQRGEAGLHGTLYAASEVLDRFATFDFNAPQRHDHNDRDYAGWNVFYNWVMQKNASVIFGTDGQYDQGNRQRFQANNRATYATLNDYRSKQLATGIFTQAQWKFADPFKLVGGARYDYFNIDITNRLNPANSGKATPQTFSPKIGLVYTPLSQVEFFTNYGKGFRTPAASEFSPNTGKANFDLGISPTHSWDLGVNLRPVPQIKISANYYQTRTEHEIRFLGDEPRNVGATRREGYELQSHWQLNKSLAVFANYAQVKARVRDAAMGQDFVAGVARNDMQAGIEWHSFVQGHAVNLELFMQHFGKAPLNETASIERPSFNRYVSKLTWARKNVSSFIQVNFQPQQNVSEAAFDIDGYRFDPKPRWDVLVGMKYQFK